MRTLKDAEAIAGTLSKPSKMPGYAYGIPAQNCIFGAKLAKVPGSVCSKCYALKGRYLFSNVKAAQQRRFASLQHPDWVKAMVFMIKFRKSEYFRWHDSGDLQGHWHLDKIVEIAQQCPEVQFWLPTRETKMIKTYTKGVPHNLVVRVSGAMIDGPPPQGFTNTSSVVSDGSQNCPASKQGNVCGSCRACWDVTVRNVSYPEH